MVALSPSRALAGKRGLDYIGVGVGAVILNEKGEILLLLRREQPEAGRWTIPGGAVEWCETCGDALRRECREEIGVEIDIVRILTVVDHIVKEEGAHWVSIEYLAAVSDGEITNACSQENEQVRWFPLDKLPDKLSQPTAAALQSYLSISNDATT